MREGQHGERPAGQRAEEAADLGQGAGLEPEDDGDHDEQDRHEVERVHGPIVAQGS